DRVIDRARAEDSVPALEVPRGVPGERADAVTRLDAVFHQPLCYLQRALSDVAIGGLDDRPLDRAGDDLVISELHGRMVDNAVASERPILHQALHSSPSFPAGLCRQFFRLIRYKMSRFTLSRNPPRFCRPHARWSAMGKFRILMIGAFLFTAMPVMAD